MVDFHLLMDELGNLLDTTLIPDKFNACIIELDEELQIQLEPDASGLNLQIASEIGEIPAGKFREKLLAAGLKYNDHHPRIGTFAYLARKNTLIFFSILELEGITAHALSEFIPSFAAIAMHWKQNVSKGSVPIPLAETNTTKPSIFDIHK